jgi:hypothetical protein
MNFAYIIHNFEAIFWGHSKIFVYNSTWGQSKILIIIIVLSINVSVNRQSLYQFVWNLCIIISNTHFNHFKFLNLAQVVWQRYKYIFKTLSFQAACRVNLINANLCYR